MSERSSVGQIASGSYREGGHAGNSRPDVGLFHGAAKGVK